MEGPPYALNGETVDELSGILPRTAEFLFSELKRLKNQGHKDFNIDVSSLEVYCENVRDLYSEDAKQNMDLITVKNKVVV